MTLAARQPATARRVRVMLVDDSAIIRGFMRRWIEQDGRIELVKACADGAQAIAEAAGCKPDVIVQDEVSSVVWGMPGSVAQADHAEAVLPLAGLGQTALRIMNGEAA